MTQQLRTPAQVRSDAARELLVHLERLVGSYAHMSADEHHIMLAYDAERITGEVARRLAAARASLATAPTPR